jgi:quercetin dioxygenase-like cupin family protein
VWAAHAIDKLQREGEVSGRAYLEFLCVPSMNVGLYELAAGAGEPRRPHEEDEIYHVISGQARLSVNGEDIAAGPGSALYAAAGIEHRFHSITEDPRLLVVFSDQVSS